MLDEPTASLSVVQTAEVLTHIERLRDLGLGVILISHNMNDVRAVSDRIEVLRHGRNNGSFDAATASDYEEILGANHGSHQPGGDPGRAAPAVVLTQARHTTDRVKVDVSCPPGWRNPLRQRWARRVWRGP